MDPITGKKADPDEFFAYTSRVVVLFRDRALGIVYNVMQVLIYCYIIFVVLIYDQGYNIYEQAKGATATQIKGEALSTSSGKPGSRYFSAEELSYPGLENGNVFVATRNRIFHQVRGVCEDLSMRCTTNDQCTASVGGTCSENGYCVEPSWCFVEGDEMPEMYEMEVGDLDIWIKSSIEFAQLKKKEIYSTEANHPFPERGYNLFSVRELLMLCEPVPVRYEEISELGAAVEVQVRWNCNVASKDCKPQVKARRLDVIFDPEQIGYSFRYSEPVSKDERMLHEMKGVRFFFRTTGQAREVSLDAVVLKIATSVTLLILPQMIADTIMLYALSKRKKYEARKYELTPDFGDYNDKKEKIKEKLEKSKADTEKMEKRMHETESQWSKRVHETDE